MDADRGSARPHLKDGLSKHKHDELVAPMDEEGDVDGSGEVLVGCAEGGRHGDGLEHDTDGPIEGPAYRSRGRREREEA